VTTSQDVPGFVSNALLMPFINEAIMCLEKVGVTLDDVVANANAVHRALRRETTLTRRSDWGWPILSVPCSLVSGSSLSGVVYEPVFFSADL
jgi:hypothetical protein